ncbi:MAG: hypothetical protein M0P17_11045 [Methanoculleus sp.]|nr:hypothetical protein [Methanoculleus sp.]
MIVYQFRSSFPVRVDDHDAGDAQEVRVFGDDRADEGLVAASRASWKSTWWRFRVS